VKLGAMYIDERCVVPRVWDTISLWEKMRGLLGRPQLQPGEGMLIGDCRLVHTVGMGYALDLAFLDKRGCVRKLVRNLSPLRMAGSFAACTTLELAAGSLDKLGLREGDYLQWREIVI
jgi:uncharacterized membrane protein (UPF0127 family)